MSKPYTMQIFPELFKEIAWDYEAGQSLKIYVDEEGVQHITFNKLYLNSLGQASYKVSNWTFSPHLWPKVVKLAELLEVTEMEKVLFVR
jgi:hypothetical protein